MAESVTITTFLELRDNMSAGLGKVEAALKKIGGAQAAQIRADREQAKAQKEKTREIEKASKAQAKAQKEQERAAEKLAKARLGPKYDPAARSQQQLRAQAEVEKRNAAFQKENERFTRAQERAASQVARAKEMAQEKARAKEARDIARAKKDFQKWGAQEAKAHERLERQKANASIREQRRVVAELSRASRRAAKEARDVARQQARAQKEHADFMGKAGAAMFGKSAGGFISAGIASPGAGMGLAAIAIADSIVTGVKRGLEIAYDLTKSYVAKVFDVGRSYQENTRRVAMTLVGMDVSPTYDIAKNQAAGFYDTLQSLAAKLPGETQDYVSVFSQGLPMALEQGEKSISRFAEISSKFTAVAFTRGITDVQHMGRDIERIMQGNALATTRMYRELRPYIGMVAKEFNKLSSAERMETLYAAIEKAADGLSGTLHDADAVVGTLQSHIEQIFRLGGAPLFQSSLAIIERINKYLTDNKQTIVDIVGLFSSRLGNLLEGAVIKILDMSKSFDRVYETVASIGSLLSDWGFLINPIIGVLAKVTGMVADLGSELEAIGLRAEVTRAKQRQTEYYEKLSKAYADPMVQKWIETRPRKQQGVDMSRGVLGHETGLTKQNEEAVKKWALQGLKMEIPKEYWAMVLQEAEDLKIHPDKVQEWFASSMQREPIDMGERVKAKKAPKERASTINDFRFSKFDIRQEFAEGFDPDRIAVAFASDLAKMGEMRMQSAYAPLFAVRGGT